MIRNKFWKTRTEQFETLDVSCVCAGDQRMHVAVPIQVGITKFGNKVNVVEKLGQHVQQFGIAEKEIYLFLNDTFEQVIVLIFRRHVLCKMHA